MSNSPPDITRLLQQVSGGTAGSADVLWPLVYDELRKIARQRLLKHRPGDTLNTTALVHEAYLKLVDQNEVAYKDRAHFFALSSRAMRFILVDYARTRTTEKRGGQQNVLSLDGIDVSVEARATHLLALDESLERLTASNERLGRLVEYKFFGDLNYEEIAEVTGRSITTLKRDWRLARAWLHQDMKKV